MYAVNSLISVVVTLCILYGCSAQNQQQLPRPNYNTYWNDQTHEELQDQDPRIYRPVPIEPQPPPQDPSVIVVPRLGLIRGKVGYKTINHRDINSFLGLHYGSVGTGLQRFQKATPFENNSNAIIDATQEPANCPQFPEVQQVMEAEARREFVDDCLTLNVHTPNMTGHYPVIVFIHGEMLFDGGAVEGQPDYFMEQDIVLVTVNYRLAPFGFLTTLTDEMPGNVALADIQLALEWVQQYIRPFGGNPEQVTVLGQAGGATIVHALSISGKAQGLFHKLILHSGTALNPYFLDEDPSSTVRSFARTAGCSSSGKDLIGLHNCFERLTTTQILQAFKSHWEANEPRGLRFTGGFKLSIGDRLGYLQQHPSALVANNTYPLIAGVAKDSGAFIMSRFYDQLVQVRSRNITDFINVVLKHTSDPRHYVVWKNWALQHIFTEEDINNPTLHGLAQGLLELTNLILYRAPLLDSIRYTSKKYPTYLFVFDYRGEYHRFGHLSNPLPFAADATLSDDSIYLFPYPEDVSQLNPEDLTYARVLTTMWSNFAHYSVPNFNIGVWPNVSTEFGPFIRFSNSKERPLELDYHFGEGIPVPNLHPQYFTTTTTTTTPRPTLYPKYENYPQYPSYPNNPSYENNPNYAKYPNYYQAQQQQPPPQQQPAYKAHETVLNDPTPLNQPQYTSHIEQSRYPYHPSRY